MNTVGNLSTTHLQITGDLPPASHDSTPVHPCPNANKDSSFSNTADSPSLANLRPKDPSSPLNPIAKELSPSHNPNIEDSPSLLNPNELSSSHRSINTGVTPDLPAAPHSHTELDTSPLNTNIFEENFLLPLGQEAAAEGSEMALPTVHATQPSPSSAMPGITSVENSSSSDGLQEIILELSLLNEFIMKSKRELESAKQQNNTRKRSFS